MSSFSYTELHAITNNIAPESEEIVIALISEFAFNTFENESGWVKAYAQNGSITEENKKEIEAIIRPYCDEISWAEITTKNWNEEWEKNYFQPIDINKIHVRAPFHPESNSEIVITIEPKMSFGTGHHHTTRLMLEVLQDFEDRVLGSNLLDMGTGSGILAIAAEKLGANKVLGIEIDDWVVDNANENIQLNNCTNTKIELGTAENLALSSNDTFDISLANIHREVLVADLSEYSRVTKENGLIFLSGIIGSDKTTIDSLAQKLNLQPICAKQSAEWMLLGYLKKES
ncbi:MAG: 50S ribosomal protein L11 methyltransferase [Bacteroidia bacterium]